MLNEILSGFTLSSLHQTEIASKTDEFNKKLQKIDLEVERFKMQKNSFNEQLVGVLSSIISLINTDLLFTSAGRTQRCDTASSKTARRTAISTEQSQRPP
jgi:uncharacterized protein YhaN